MLKKVLFTALACTAMVFAAGNSSQQQDQEGAAGQQEMMTAQGTIQEINIEEGYFTLETEEGTDTIYFDESQLNISLDELTQMQGQDVDVQYTTENGRKMAMMIAPAGQGGAAGQQEMMTAQGTIKEINVEEGYFTLETEEGTDTIYFDESQLNISLDELTQMQGQDVDVQYTTENGRKMAMMIAPAGQGGAAGEGEKKENGQKPEEQPQEEMQ